MNASVQTGTGRVDWVDGAKGICIIMVVMMHSTLGVEDALGQQGFMHAFVAFARPFRMPDFFLISGLFLARVIDRDWQTYLDKKVVHFAYFYVLWVTIQFAVKAPAIVFAHGFVGLMLAYLEAFIEPFGTLWFIYLLPIFFVVTKATRNVPPLLIWLVAAALEIAPIDTGWTVIDEFAGRFVYFYTGYLLAPRVFALAELVRARPWLALVGLEAWTAINGALVLYGYAGLPFVSLVLGFAGALAVIAVAVLISRLTMFEPIRYCGRNSIVIYLAFFLPMLLTRLLLIKSGVIPDVGVQSLIVTLVGVVGALAIWWAVRDARLSFLFVRPAQFYLKPRPSLGLQPAE
jgi:uncharacterized membrane protein YcfT